MAQTAVVGVSGGVDSAVTLLTLREQGYDVFPVFLKLKEGLSVEDDRRLNRLEEVTGISVYRLDGRGIFAKHITGPFIECLSQGITPNPCVWCNQHVKLKLLFDYADTVGAQFVSTGHYARIIHTAEGPRLARAQSSKDQSYMLYRIPKEWVSRLIFPLSFSEKEAVRNEARLQLGQSHGDGDSQDICFLGNETLEQYINGRIDIRTGMMVDKTGKVLGKHKGLAHYTLGQRKGLGLSGGPWFVIDKDLERDELILDRQPAKTTELKLTDCRWLGKPSGPLQVKTRYRGQMVGCELVVEAGTARVKLEEPLWGVAPGQSAVIYEGDLVVGGGYITAKE